MAGRRASIGSRHHGMMASSINAGALHFADGLNWGANISNPIRRAPNYARQVSA